MLDTWPVETAMVGMVGWTLAVLCLAVGVGRSVTASTWWAVYWRYCTGPSYLYLSSHRIPSSCVSVSSGGGHMQVIHY